MKHAITFLTTATQAITPVIAWLLCTLLITLLIDDIYIQHNYIYKTSNCHEIEPNIVVDENILVQINTDNITFSFQSHPIKNIFSGNATQVKILDYIRSQDCNILGYKSSSKIEPGIGSIRGAAYNGPVLLIASLFVYFIFKPFIRSATNPIINLSNHLPISIGLLMALIFSFVIILSGIDHPRYTSLNSHSKNDLFYSLVLSSLVGPISEEIVFRRLMLQKYINNQFIFTGAIISSITFASLHSGIPNSAFSISIFALLTTASLVFSCFYIKYGLRKAITAHITYNLSLIIFDHLYNSHNRML